MEHPAIKERGALGSALRLIEYEFYYGTVKLFRIDTYDLSHEKQYLHSLARSVGGLEEQDKIRNDAASYIKIINSNEDLSPQQKQIANAIRLHNAFTLTDALSRLLDSQSTYKVLSSRSNGSPSLLESSLLVNFVTSDDFEAGIALHTGGLDLQDYISNQFMLYREICKNVYEAAQPKSRFVT